MIRIVTSNVCKAFEAGPVGSKVTDATRFLDELETALGDFEFPDGSGESARGQGFVVCPTALPYVSAGEGRRTADPADYVPREHRGEVGLFLRRERAAEATFLGCVVYTLEADLADPDVQGEPEEAERVRRLEATHVLVAVIAAAAPQAPLTHKRLVANLAGGNNEALKWSAERIREEARKVDAHWSEWCVVAG